MHATTSIDVLERAAADFASLISAGPMDLPVPSCPGWSIADLARHLGGIHRWALEAVTRGKPGAEPAGPVEPSQVTPWVREGAVALVAALRSRSPDDVCWTFGDPGTARFWMRRQAHETTVHAWDAATARGVAYHIDDALAWDGLDEVATMFLPRQVRLGRLATGPEVVELRAVCGSRMVLATDAAAGTAPPTAVVTGPADLLLLLVWRRIPLSDPRLVVAGNRADAMRLLSLAITP